MPPSYFFLQVAVLVGLHTILCHRKFCGASPFRGRCVWTPFPTCSSPCHLFLTVYPKETKACWTRRGILKCPFCVSEEFRELGGKRKPLRAERSVSSACMCAHTKVIIMMMNGTGWRGKKTGSAYQVVWTLFSFPGLKFLGGSLG